MRTYKVVFRDAKGNRVERDVRADSEADALLAAKQMIRAQYDHGTGPSLTARTNRAKEGRIASNAVAARAIPITKD